MSVIPASTHRAFHISPNGEEVLHWMRERFNEARLRKFTLRLQGAGSHSRESAELSAISLRGYQGIVEYKPSDLVVTVRTGTSLVGLVAELASEGQMLGFDPAVADESTIGGAVALGWSGPRRPYAGGLRDHLLGVRLVDGRGRDLRFGGRTVKNVAGFDVARLCGGSLGMLGALLEVSLRVVPSPELECTQVMACSAVHALGRMNELGQGPGLLSGAVYLDGHLYLRYSGRGEVIRRTVSELPGETCPSSESTWFWNAVTQQTHEFFRPQEGQTLWRTSIRPDAPLFPHALRSAFDWAGGLRWLWMPGGEQPLLEKWAQQYGGYTGPWQAGLGYESSRVPVGPLASLQESLAGIFDPYRLFDRSSLQVIASRTSPCA